MNRANARVRIFDTKEDYKQFEEILEEAVEQFAMRLLAYVRYIERNPKRANMVQGADEWQWSSVWRREHGSVSQKKLLSPWPVSAPKNYLNWLNAPQTSEEEESIQRSI